MTEKRDIYILCFQGMGTLYICLPGDYEKETGHYPVLYMFDGHNLLYDEDATFGRSWGLKRWLDEHTVPLIVVGVERNYEGNRRLEEFSPYDFSDATAGFIYGWGKELMGWMSSNFKRWIGHAYRTLPGKHHTVIGGNSMDGLMALCAAVHHCDIYSKAAVLSPFIYRLKDGLLTEIWACPRLCSHKIYISWESDEFHTKQQLMLASGRILELMCRFEEKEAKVHPNLVFKGRHNGESWEQEPDTALTWLFTEQKSGYLKSALSVFTAEYSQSPKRA